MYVAYVEYICAVQNQLILHLSITIYYYTYIHTYIHV